jgi:two-component system KDP operon response regulator KdpE
MSPKQHAPHILVADDEPRILKLFTRLLSDDGYSVTAVDSGEAAVRVLKEQPVDLLILDLSMPEPDGFDVLRSLRAQKPGLRILVISGFMEGALLRASEILGATATLNKTEAPQRLVHTVRTLLR